MENEDKTVTYLVKFITSRELYNYKRNTLNGKNSPFETYYRFVEIGDSGTIKVIRESKTMLKSILNPPKEQKRLLNEYNKGFYSGEYENIMDDGTKFNVIGAHTEREKIKVEDGEFSDIWENVGPEYTWSDEEDEPTYVDNKISDDNKISHKHVGTNTGGGKIKGGDDWLATNYPLEAKYRDNYNYNYKVEPEIIYDVIIKTGLFQDKIKDFKVNKRAFNNEYEYKDADQILIYKSFKEFFNLLSSNETINKTTPKKLCSAISILFSEKIKGENIIQGLTQGTHSYQTPAENKIINFKVSKLKYNFGDEIPESSYKNLFNKTDFKIIKRNMIKGKSEVSDGNIVGVPTLINFPIHTIMKHFTSNEGVEYTDFSTKYSNQIFTEEDIKEYFNKEKELTDGKAENINVDHSMLSIKNEDYNINVLIEVTTNADGKTEYKLHDNQNDSNLNKLDNYNIDNNVDSSQFKIEQYFKKMKEKTDGGRKRRGSKKMKRKNRKTTRSRRNA